MLEFILKSIVLSIGVGYLACFTGIVFNYLSLKKLSLTTGFYFIWQVHPFDDHRIFQVVGTTDQVSANKAAIEVLQGKFDRGETCMTSCYPTTPERVRELNKSVERIVL